MKTKKQLNLPQLIEWAWDNPDLSANKRFISENKEFPGIKQYVIFNEECYAEVESSYCYGRKDIFTVEVEEEITEDTVFDYLLLTYKKDNDEIETHRYIDDYIKSVLNQSSRLMYVSEQLSITYFDDKGIPHLIWSDGKLVE